MAFLKSHRFQMLQNICKSIAHVINFGSLVFFDFLKKLEILVSVTKGYFFAPGSSQDMLTGSFLTGVEVDGTQKEVCRRLHSSFELERYVSIDYTLLVFSLCVTFLDVTQIWSYENFLIKLTKLVLAKKWDSKTLPDGVEEFIFLAELLTYPMLKTNKVYMKTHLFTALKVLKLFFASRVCNRSF